MRQIIILFSILNMLFCVNKNDNIYQNELNLNKLKWDDSKISNYQFTYFESCECANYGTFNIVVKNHIIDSIFPDTSRDFVMPRNTYVNYPTVDTLFNMVQRAIDDKEAEIIQVKYNHEFGYPDTIFVDWNPKVTDFSVYIKISKFDLVNSVK